MGTLQSLTAGALLRRLGIRGFRDITISSVKNDTQSISVNVGANPFAVLANGCIFTDELTAVVLSSISVGKSDGTYALCLDELEDGTQAPEYELHSQDSLQDLLVLAFINIRNESIDSISSTQSGLNHPFHPHFPSSMTTSSSAGSANISGFVTTNMTVAGTETVAAEAVNSSSEISNLDHELNAAAAPPIATSQVPTPSAKKDDAAAKKTDVSIEKSSAVMEKTPLLGDETTAPETFIFDTPLPASVPKAAKATKSDNIDMTQEVK